LEENGGVAIVTKTLPVDGKFFKQEPDFAKGESLLMKFLLMVVLAATLTLAANADIEVRRDGRSWAVIESDGDVRIDGRGVGTIEKDGDVRKDGRGIGVVEADGDIRWDGRSYGVIEDDGDLRVDGRHVGVIEADGDIRRDGRSWGSASEVHCYDDVRKLAALLVFFSGDF
jgi:hypothetical protein